MSQEIKIEDGVPIQTTRHQTTKYPFDLMLVGQSFTVEGTLRSMASTVCRRNKQHPETTFITRKDGNRIRIWRTA